MTLVEEIEMLVENGLAVRIELEEGEGWMKVLHPEAGCIETHYLGEMGGNMDTLRDAGAEVVYG